MEKHGWRRDASIDASIVSIDVGGEMYQSMLEERCINRCWRRDVSIDARAHTEQGERKLEKRHTGATDTQIGATDTQIGATQTDTQIGATCPAQTQTQTHTLAHPQTDRPTRRQR